MNLQEWWTLRKQKRKQEQRNAGFDYAMGAIIRGEKTPLELDAEQHMDYRDQFDVGIDNAIDYAVQHKIVKDDRF